jgi:hypothetical protein
MGEGSKVKESKKEEEVRRAYLIKSTDWGKA